MARILLIHNPAARQAPGAELLGAIRQEMERADWSVEIAPTRKAGHAVEMARAAGPEGFHRVVVCGGDGSVREAAEGLMGTGVPLGIIPLGTANVLSYEMGLPVSDSVACASVAARGKSEPVGLGTVGDRAFTFSASCGLDALAVEHVDLSLKRIAGKFAYGAAAVESLLRKEIPVFEVETESGERIEACQIFAARARRYAGADLFLSRRANLKSPTMRLIALPPPLYRHLASILRLPAEGLDEAPGTVCHEVRSFRLRGEGALPIQADGDLMTGVEPFFASHADALNLVFPA